MNAEPQVGDRHRFIPAANYDHSAGFAQILMKELSGVIVEVNEEHRWFRVEYRRGEVTGYECFKY